MLPPVRSIAIASFASLRRSPVLIVKVNCDRIGVYSSHLGSVSHLLEDLMGMNRKIVFIDKQTDDNITDSGFWTFKKY